MLTIAEGALKIGLTKSGWGDALFAGEIFLLQLEAVPIGEMLFEIELPVLFVPCQ